ncbi:hypothetical protein EDD16DRAFT_823295 [Pisolithus croceorrhizus]|nr:hypothetical protein EDD16DRAFT_823295 [Pisolithus croceorrhizus]KAI6136277.1 hypothetical protein F5141DRAFT_1185303 [Pisolithus sp. B1]
MSSASTSGLSAAVTRILYLSGFPKELKTRDIHTAFAEWENMSGGFKIKWRDDTSLLIVFQDASVAKRAYLHTLAFPPSIMTANSSAVIRPYDAPDAQLIIQAVNSRGLHNSNPSRTHNMRAASISVFPTRSANNSQSGSSGLRNGAQNGHVLNMTISEHAPNRINGREPSPTLPSLPSHPSLNDLINSSMPPEDPAILHAEGPPKIGEPGKRMLGAALGVRHPGLGPRVVNGGMTMNGGSAAGSNGLDRDVQKAMSGLAIAE